MSKTKTSPNKIEANRRNAKKSTGPRSAAGKAKSSRNAVKHGLLAGLIVLADHKDEDPQQFGLLLDGLRDDYQPQSTIETMLVERLAASFWRLRRAYRFEVEAITQANRPNPLADALDELSPLPPVERGERILPSPYSLDRLIRYETMIDRELLRTMRQLESRQRLRKIEQAPDHHAQARPLLSRALQGPDRAQPVATEVRGLKATAEHGDAKDLRQQAAGKAPAPNEPTATPSAGSATRCERRSSLAGAVPRTGMLHRGFPTLAVQGWGPHAVRPARPPVLMCCPLHWQQAASGAPARRASAEARAGVMAEVGSRRRLTASGLIRNNTLLTGSRWRGTRLTFTNQNELFRVYR
ncbi:MAG: hypothetical protein IIB58_07640 [Planctomycetes bacterium]|nr:hypothetical protein [Planctomycetota bacterium]